MYVQRTTTYKKTVAIVFACVVLWSFPDLAHGFFESAGRELGTLFYAGVIGATGWLLAVTSYAFDFALGHFVWNFGEYYQNYFGFAIEQTWQVVRDLMNFVFIFGLIYIGFRFILNAEDQTAKKSLILLILAALLVNFSLFATKAIVDISHLAAKQLQSPIQNESMENVSYADALVQSLRVTSVLSDDILETNPDGTYKMELSFIWLIGLAMLSGALILVASFTLGSLALLLVSRFVSLTFLMIFSPILFLGWVFPGMSSVSKKWSDTFLKQAFLAPALILFLSIALAMVSLISQIDGVDASGGLLTAGGSSGSAGDSTAMGAAVATKIPFFIVAIGFFIGALLAARIMGTIGAQVTISAGQKLSNKARGYVQRGATAPVRYPARALTNYAGEKTSKGLTRLQSSDSWAGSIARTNTADRMIRGTSEAAANARFGTVATNKENRDYARGIQTRANQQRAVNQREQEFNSHLDVLNNTNATAAELNTAFEDLGKTIKNMTKEEKEQLSHEQLTSEHIALNLSDKDIEGLESSGKFSPQQIEDIRDSRKNAFNSVASNGSTLNPNANYTGNTAALRNTQRAALVTRSSEEVGNMSVDVFTNPDMVEHLTPAMVEQRMRNGRITNAQLQTIRTNIQNHITNPNTPQRTTDMWTHWSTNTTYGAQLGL